MTAPPLPPRHRPGERFLRGPVQWLWLQAASRCGGKSLAVGLAVWHLVGITGKASVPLSIARVAGDLGFDRASGSRGLRALERAGLVTVSRAPGRKVLVTVCIAPQIEDVR